MHAPLRQPVSSPIAPGRGCPLHYRYAPDDLAREPELRAEALYVVGGLYGNRPALDAVLELLAHEPVSTTLVFNGDFNWFNVDAAGFAAISDLVLNHTALRGNVETEIAGDDEAAGCGCAYPESVSDAEVARSNRILDGLRGTARHFPSLRTRLAALPMHLVVEIAGMRIGIVHGDAESLAGWSYSQEALAGRGSLARLAGQFDRASVRIFASSHTCLPVAVDCDARQGRCVLINNGAAGMPNFAGMACGVITRIATIPCRAATPLYSTQLGPLHIDALALQYDKSRWVKEFLANWPPGTAAHESYFHRIMCGPNYRMEQAVRWRASRSREARPTVVENRGAGIL